MCFGSSKSNTKPPEPTPPTTFSYRAGADSLKAQQQQVVANAVPKQAPLGSELAPSAPAARGSGEFGFGDSNYGAGGAAY